MGQRDHLPHLPKDNIFKGSKTEVMDNLKNGDKESDTIFNLVHLGRKKGEEEAPIPSTPIAEKDEGEEFFSEKTISVVLIIISLIGIGYFANLNFSTPKKRISKRSRSAKKEVSTQRAAQRKRPERPKRADAPPPPPDRGQESSPKRPSRDNKTISTIKRDRPLDYRIILREGCRTNLSLRKEITLTIIETMDMQINDVMTDEIKFERVTL